MIPCPRCGLTVTELHPPDPDLLVRLQALGQVVAGDICAGCISDLKKAASGQSGTTLQAQERAREQHRLNLWKSRVTLVKRGRDAMNAKRWSDAAVAYEKYLKILEIVFDCKKGQALTPDHFRKNSQTSELTVVTSIYWDLFRVYDTSDRYSDRQAQVAKQLANFLRFTPIFPDIIKKAEAFQKTSRNPGAVKQLLRLSTEDRPRCFIATSAFETPQAIEVQLLRHYRDFYLKNSKLGRQFILAYYQTSPHIARILDSNSKLKPLIRAILRLLIKCVSR